MPPWLLLAAALAGGEGPVLRIASDATFPPFHFIDGSGAPTGFDIELARLIAERAGFQPLVVVRPYDDLLAGLATGAHELVAATTGITPEREKLYLFTRPYFETCQAALVRVGPSEPRTTAELKGRRVGAAGSGTSARALRGIAGARQVSLGKGQAGVPALEGGDIDALIADEFGAVATARASNGRLRVLPQPVARELYAFVLPRGRDDLKRGLDRALEELEREGAVRALRVRFGVERDEGWPVRIEGSSPQASGLGSIQFPNSGAPAAQPAFVEGVKDLHSFEFDEAAAAFRKVQQADPGFALAYWGEAMSYNHPLWAEVDLEAARTALGRLAPTPDGRLAMAKTAKEKGYLDAADRLFGADRDKLARDEAYSQAMRKMHELWPDDHEVATFYALSLLGTVRPGDKGFRRQALAASIALKVYKENPSHPGAAHFIIHAFDDPDHAPLALEAARSYAKIAPSAPHALHMPSHIFVQLGLWQDAIDSNVVAYRAAADRIARLHLREGREDFHALSWLIYADLMAGRVEEAKANLDLARQTAERNPTSDAIRNYYLGMRALCILETGKWEAIPVADPGGTGADEHAGMPGMAGQGAGYHGATMWTFVAGVSAVNLGDLATAEKAESQLRRLRTRTEAGGDAYAARPLAVMEKELAALTKLARGQNEEAVRLAKEAADIELTLNPPSGPPDPIKPALELYGDVLLAAGRAQEAAAAYEQALLRTPNRTPSVKGLARARATTPP